MLLTLVSSSRRVVNELDKTILRSYAYKVATK